MDEIEREAIEQALKATDGNAVAAANLLGVGQATIYRKVKRYGITIHKAKRAKRLSKETV